MIDNEEFTIDKEDIIHAVNDTFRDHWPVCHEQVFYHLLKSGKIEDVGNSYRGFLEVLGAAISDGEISSSATLDNFRDGSEIFLLYESLEDRRLNFKEGLTKSLLRIPDFEVWHGQKNHVEVWVDDEDLLRFLRIHLDKKIPVFTYGAYHLPFDGAMQETIARLQYMEEIEERNCVILYIGDLNVWAWDHFEKLQKCFKPLTYRFERIVVNVDQVGELVPESQSLELEGDSEECRQFQKEFGLKGSYTAQAFAPNEILGLVHNAINRYYDMDKYPFERIAEWQKVHTNWQRDYLREIDRLLGIRQ